MSIGTRVDIEQKFFTIVRRREHLHDQACAAATVEDNLWESGIRGETYESAIKHHDRLKMQIRELDEKTYQMALSDQGRSSRIFRYEFERLSGLKRRQLFIVDLNSELLAECNDDFHLRTIERFTKRAQNTERMILQLVESVFPG